MKLSEQKKLQILKAAELLFYTQGVAHTSMDQVAKDAEVSKRTVYNHFESKEVLLLAIMQDMLGSLEEGPIIVFDKTRELSEQLVVIAQHEVRLLTSDRFLRLAKIAFMQMLQDPQFAQSVNASDIGCQRYLSDFLNQAIKNNKLEIDNIELATKQFIYQLKSFIFYPKLYGFAQITDLDVENIIKETVKMWLARYEA